MGRRCLIGLVVLGTSLLLPASASAVTTNVTAGGAGNVFTPSAVTINHGDTVQWSNAGGIHNVHLDNGSFDQPPSPSSTAWVVSKTFTTTGTYRYYCELHGGPGGSGMSGTVTVRAPYQAPAIGDRVHVPLVPVFRQAGTGGNPVSAGHAPPLAVGSAAPPLTSGVAHVGATTVGRANLTTIPGDVNTSADEADVMLGTNTSDVHAGDSFGPDYDPNPDAPDMTLVTKLRITDLLNGGSASDPATVTDIDFSVPVDCATTSDPSLGSTCSVNTTADAISPGTILEGRSTIVQAFRVRLNDSGVDNLRGTADDRLFEQQGVFVP